jgi:hypothetical protein
LSNSANDALNQGSTCYCLFDLQFCHLLVDKLQKRFTAWQFHFYKSNLSLDNTTEQNLLLAIQVLKFNLTESGLFCVLPWLTMAFSANLGGWIADTLVSKGLSVTTVRKVSLRVVQNSPIPLSYHLCFICFFLALFISCTFFVHSILHGK